MDNTDIGIKNPAQRILDAEIRDAINKVVDDQQITYYEIVGALEFIKHSFIDETPGCE